MTERVLDDNPVSGKALDSDKYKRKQYDKKTNTMVDNTGVTFGIFKYEEFSGDIVTGKNRKALMMMYTVEYMQKLVESGEVDRNEKVPPEIWAEAVLSAKERIRMNQKAYKAYKQGKQYFRYRGNKMIVPTVEREKKMRESLKEIQDKYSPEDLEGKDIVLDEKGNKPFFVELDNIPSDEEE